MAYIVDNVSGTGGGGLAQATVLYVDSVNGDDGNVGSLDSPKKTIKAAVADANAGYLVQVSAGVYAETLPIDITVENLSIVGVAQRSCFVHPTTATQYGTMFRCNSGTYIDGFTFAGLKAAGTRGAQPIDGVNPDTDPVYGLPANQGWVAGFLPGCIIRKSPYINNCTNFADSSINNDFFDPNNYAGTGGDTNSAPTGGGIIVDGSLPDVTSPLRSMVVNEFTQVCLDGPGLLVCNNGYAQAVSFFGLFCHYHAKALSGGQINMEVGTTDFGRYGIIADGKSPAAIFAALSVGTASAGSTTFVIGAPTASGTWFGDATRPSLNMLVQIGANIYPILSGTASGAGWTVEISNPNPANYSQNLGLITGFSAGTTVSFFLRSMVSTASHTMEYAGSGTDYSALPENGGVPDETKEVVNLNNGKVWLTSTDQSGKFKVGSTFAVNQQTGYIQIDPAGLVIASNVSSDPNPALGGALDLRNYKIYTSFGNTDITIEANGTGAVLFGNAIRAINGTAALPSISFTSGVNTGIYRAGAETIGFTTNGTAKATIDDTAAPIKEVFSSVFYPIVTQVDIGTDPNQVPLNGLLGTMAFQDSDGVSLGAATISSATISSATISGGTATLSSAAVTAFSNVPLLTGGGLKFPPTQVASADPTTLDDYEEGTWTPTMNYATAYGTQTGKYVKIGNLVNVWFEIQVTAWSATSASTFVSAPFSIDKVTGSWGAVINAVTTNVNWRIGPYTASGTPALWAAGGSGASGILLTETTFDNYSALISNLGTSFTMRGGFSYIAA